MFYQIDGDMFSLIEDVKYGEQNIETLNNKIWDRRYNFNRECDVYEDSIAKLFNEYVNVTGTDSSEDEHESSSSLEDLLSS